VAKEILPGLYRIPLMLGPIPYTKAYLITSGDELVLVDTGIPKRGPVFMKLLQSLRRKPFDVRHILITHHHYDHTGNLAWLSEKTGARIYVHPLDAAITRGDEPPPKPRKTGLQAKVIGAIGSRMMPERMPHVSISHELQDGEELPIAGGITALHTPGHTPGHTSFLWKEHGGVLLVGDAAANMTGRVAPPIGVYTEDDAAMRRSVRKLAGFRFDKAVFGHGNPVKSGASEKFAKLADRLGV
jgi:glyoxylase-like metal-dependent hydrolase (beta-lactamase superfamily II)